MMKAFYKPYWIAITVTLPLALVFLYYTNIYTTIASELAPEHIKYWLRNGLVLGALLVGGSVYGLLLQRSSRPVSWIYALLMAAGCLLFGAFHLEGVWRMIPITISEWMVSSTDAVLLPLGLIMPALIHALLLLVLHLTPGYARRTLFKTLFAAIVLPALWYLAVRFVTPMLRGAVGWGIMKQVEIGLFVILSTAFMFLLMRLGYLLAMKFQRSRSRAAWLLRGAAAILLPLMALLVYNGKLNGIDQGYISELQFIGDWSHPVYYLLVIINGILISLPRIGHPPLALARFAGLVLLYPIIFYFFVVFLPLFPLAIGSVVLFGLGFLLLAPLLLFALNTWTLTREFAALRPHYGTRTPAAILLIGFALIPAALTLSYSADRATLSMMLDHVYEADYDSDEPLDLDLDSAERVLGHIRTVKQNGDIFSSDRKPYLTAYYQWLVLDSLTLSNSKLDTLERIFLGKQGSGISRNERLPQTGPTVTRVKGRTRRSEDGSYYVSTVDIEITNQDDWQFAQDEFASRFHLPPGAWVRNYYLIIDGKRMEGILSERKSALWVYQQARNVRRDPGLLYYTSPNELILRIFPFGPGETRQTGFELIHREPLTLKLGDKRVRLAGNQPLTPLPQASDASSPIVWVSAAQKAALPHTLRRPYLHFIVDRSSTSANRLQRYSRLIDQFVAHHLPQGVDTRDARITLANFNSQTLPYQPNWVSRAETLPASGGFFLERALKRTLSQNYTCHEGRYPLFVVVTDHFDKAIFTEGMADFMPTMPEGDQFIVLNNDMGGSLRQLTNRHDPVKAGDAFKPASRSVLAWPNAELPLAFLPDDDRASLIITGRDKAGNEPAIDENAWLNGLQLYGQWLESRLRPGWKTAIDRTIIANSFHAQLLSPLTAFLSPESEVQRQVLLKKQQQILEARSGLDLGEEQQMDEPPLWLMLLPAALYGLRRRRYRSA